MVRATMAAVLALAISGAARAEVAETGPQGFRLKLVQQIAAPPAKVWAALGEVGRWWDGAHTYSGRSENLSLALHAGACFCESVPPGGSVRHGVVVLALPAQGLLRLDAALGPLQAEGVSGALTYQLKAKDGGTELTTNYNVGGARDFIVSVAPAVDQVLSGQMVRLKRYVETGAP